MRHNKFVGLESFLGLLEHVHKVSPWLSRQIAKHASDWPFWFSGLQVREWSEHYVRVHLPFGVRTAIDGELCQGHLVLGAELALRLCLVRLAQEFPFTFRLRQTRTEITFAPDRAVDYKFALPNEAWETLRLALARETKVSDEFVVQAFFDDGRLSATFAFTVAFTLVKSLSAK